LLYNGDFIDARLKLSKDAVSRGKGLVGVYHTHNIALGHNKGPNISDVKLNKEFLGMISFILYYEGQLHVIPYRKSDHICRSDEDIEKASIEFEKRVRFFKK